MKHFNKIYLIILLLPFLKGFGCGDNRLILKNNSDSNIYVWFSCDKDLSDLQIHRPKVDWFEYLNDSVNMESHFYIKKNSFRNLIMRGSWPGFFKSCYENKVYFVIIDESIAATFSDYEIIEKKLFAKKMVFSLNEIKKNKWIINYP